MGSEKEKKLVSSEEEQDISRKMMVWVNSFSDDDLPAATINYEFLAADSASVALSVIPGTYITQKYIFGGHEAEYQFKNYRPYLPRQQQRQAPESGRSAEPIRRLGDAELSVFGRWNPRPAHGCIQPRGVALPIQGRFGRPPNFNEDDLRGDINGRNYF